MQSDSSEREILFGILAMQNDLISHEQFLLAFQSWSRQKPGSLVDTLVENHEALRNLKETVHSLVDAHLAIHGGDSEKSLAALKGALSPQLHQEIYAITDTGGLESVSTMHDDVSLDMQATRSIGRSSTSGRFQILRPLAAGGLGEVFVALDEELNREVALKQIKDCPGEEEEQRDRFLREAEITGKLEHPGIVPVYGMGEDDEGRPYYAMRFIRGSSLKEEIKNYYQLVDSQPQKRSERNRQFRRLLGCFVDVCNAIEYAHSRGVLHRDLKPGNIMLGCYGETLVVDWGLARVAGVEESGRHTIDEQPLISNLSGSSSETVAGTALGSPGYMSPEQADGRLDLLSPQTDVYCLGATLFSILTGSPPVSGNFTEVLRRVTTGDWERPRQLNPDAPLALESICCKAMSLRPEDRYETPTALAADIESWLADEPVSTLKESIPAQIWRWTRTHQMAVTVAAAAILILATTSSIATLTLQGKNQELESANASVQESNRELQLANEREVDARMRADRVKEFLVSAFRKLDPTEDSRSISVAKVLNRAAEEIDEDFADEPRMRVDLLSAIATSYQGLGLRREAYDTFVKEQQLRLELDGETDAQVLKANYNVAQSTYYVGDYDEAIALHRSNLERQREVLGDEHSATLTSLNGLAMALAATGEYQQSLEIYEDLVTRRKALHGEKAPATLMAINNLATSYQSNGRLTDALELFAKNYEDRRALHGDHHHLTLLAMDRLASIHNAIGNSEQAIALYRSALEQRRSILGDDHPSTVESISGLAFALRDNGRAQEARPLIEESLEANRNRFGEEHPATIRSTNDLARIYLTLGLYNEALTLALPGYELSLRELGETSPTTLAFMNTLGMAYFRLGQVDKTVPHFERLVEAYIKLHGEDHPTTVTMMNNLAMTYRDVGKYNSALPLLEKSLEWRRKEFGDSHPKTLVSMQNLAGVYRLVGKLDEAVELAQQSVKLHEEKLGTDHRQTLSAVHVLAQTYLDRDELRAALESANLRVSRSQTALGEAHPDTLQGEGLVGLVLLKMGQTDESQALLNSTYEQRLAILGEDHPATLTTQLNLALLQFEIGNLDEGCRLAEKVQAAISKKLGATHPTTLRAMDVVGRGLTANGRSEEGRVLLQETLEKQIQTLGEQHPKTLKTKYDLAVALRACGRLSSATELVLQTLRLQKQVLGPAHADTVATSLEAATCLCNGDNPSQAEPLLDDVWKQFNAAEADDMLPCERDRVTETIGGYIELFSILEDDQSKAEWASKLSDMGNRP